MKWDLKDREKEVALNSVKQFCVTKRRVDALLITVFMNE